MTIIASGTVAKIELRCASRAASSPCTRFRLVTSWLFCSTAVVAPSADRRGVHRLWIDSRDPSRARWSSSPCQAPRSASDETISARADRIAGVEQVVDTLPDGLGPGIAVETLAPVVQ